MTTATGSSSATVATRPRGVMISCARRSPNASERSSSAAVPPSSVPCSAERRTSDESSSGERAEASSSCGSIPIRRSIAFAVPLKKRTITPATRVKPRRKPWTARAVASGFAIARFFGTSSPKIIVTPVARTSAIASATPDTAPSGTPALVSGPRTRSAIAGSARKPISRLVSVMPTCADESCVDRWRSAVCTPRADLSPASAARSTDERSTVTNANSAATNAPHATTSASAITINRISINARPSADRRRERAWDYSWGRRSSTSERSGMRANDTRPALSVASRTFTPGHTRRRRR